MDASVGRFLTCPVCLVLGGGTVPPHPGHSLDWDIETLTARCSYGHIFRPSDLMNIQEMSVRLPNLCRRALREFLFLAENKDSQKGESETIKVGGTDS